MLYFAGIIKGLFFPIGSMNKPVFVLSVLAEIR